MEAFARHQVELSKVGKDGKTLRETLEAVARLSRRRPAELDGPEIPPELIYLWDWFMELNSARQSNGFGPSPLSWVEIATYFRLHGITPEPWELDLLRRLDRLALEAMAPPANK